MSAKLKAAFGYQGDAMALPVANVDTAAPFYVERMGFSIVEHSDQPHKRVVLERDGIRMSINENGGDPSQDGVAFPTNDVGALRDEFVARGLDNIGGLQDETRDDGSYKVFFVVAPDGLCFWFGQKLG